MMYEQIGGTWAVQDAEGNVVVFATAEEAQKMNSEQAFIARVRTLNKAIWDSIIELHGLQTEWDKRQFGTTLDDGEGENAGITAVQVGAVVFDSADALMAVLTGGTGGNMAALL